MHVVATAGHVDHGKSTLVRALTGQEPDRWAEERRRGMTIDLGFAWTTLWAGRTIAFVDVPGHERFVPNMLAGVGPVPAVLLVVAADGGWMPQTAEHVDALDALGVRHGLVAVTRSDLADPLPAMASVAGHLAGTSLAGSPAVAVSATTGAGLDELRAALVQLTAGLPDPDAEAPVRLWIDRAFTVQGAGTVVTGTLGAGTLRRGDRLELVAAGHGTRAVQVRGLQALGRTEQEVRAVARVAVNLRGVHHDHVARGDALLAPGPWRATQLLDARVTGEPSSTADLVLHLGSAAVPARVRPLGADAARITLHRALPLRAGDTGLLRDPGGRAVLGRVTVLDVAPEPFTRRGAAKDRARELAHLDGTHPPDGAEMLRRRGIAHTQEFAAVGAEPPADAARAGDWLVDAAVAGRLRRALAAQVAEYLRIVSVVEGPTVQEMARALSLPDPAVVAALAVPPLAVRDGRVVPADGTPLPPEVARAVAQLAADLAEAPFAAPDALRLKALGLGRRELAAAERAGALVRVTEGVVLLPGAPELAAGLLAGLPQPFTLSAARLRLGTSRRVAVPLLELLDRRRLTRRLPDDRRTVREDVSPGATAGA